MSYGGGDDGGDTFSELSEVFALRAWAYPGSPQVLKVLEEPGKGPAWDQSLEGRQADSVVLSSGLILQSSEELSGMHFLLRIPALFSWHACA